MKRAIHNRYTADTIPNTVPMTPRDNAFGKQLKARREALDLTQQALGQRIGCSVITIRKIETGERKPSRQLAELLALHLKVPEAEKASFIAFARDAAPSLSGAPSTPPGRAGPARPPINLPPHLAPLIGREADIEAVLTPLHLGQARLVTLTGPGGVGKTSLARAVVHTLVQQDAHNGPVVWVELAALTQAIQVVPAIARVLGMVLDAPADVLRSVIDYLSSNSTSTLLVLDNVEHVLEAKADIATMLAACPTLHVLATSRVPFRLPGELRIIVAPLTSRAAERLFIQRAREAAPYFAPDPQALLAVSELCTHLDGLPLAIELVAARTALMTPQAMLIRFVKHGGVVLPLVADGTSDLPSRQHTLHASIAWSLDLLDRTVRDAFCRLSVFAGDFTLDAAMRVACLTGPVESDSTAPQQVAAWNTLTSLLDANLLMRHEPRESDTIHSDANVDGRFILLETVRTAGRDELTRSGILALMLERHARYYAWRAQTCASDYARTHHIQDLGWIQACMPNILAAGEYLIAHGQAEQACRLCAACDEVWKNLAYFAEGLALTERALVLPGDATNAYKSARANALITSVRLSAETSEHVRTLARCDEALALFRSIGDERGVWAAMHQRAWQVRRTNANGWMLHTELLDIVRDAGDTYWTAIKLADLAVMSCFDWGEYEAAVRYADEAADLFEVLDADWGLTYALSTKGSALQLLGRLDEASAILTVARELAEGGSTSQLAHLEEALGTISLARGDAKEAVMHFAEVVHLATRHGSPLSQHQALVHQGLAELAAGDAVQAETHFRGALSFFDASPDIGSEQCFGAMCRIGLARIAAAAGRRAGAIELLRDARVVIDLYPTSFDAQVRGVMDEACRLITSQ